MELLSDMEFAGYHIIRRLGSGATADVFLAEQCSLGRQVALKVLKKDFANDETYVRRFLREARAVAALNHPNIVQIYQTDCLDGNWCFAQEYVQGENLQQEIQRAGALPVPKVIDLLWQTSAALEAAAEAGIVHRDIKPENILLAPNGIVKVADFGLVHMNIPAANQSHLALTEVGMTLGTPLYMSPEQAQGLPIDHRSDIYSLGITCWHALAGKPPFHGETALSVALQHVNTPPPPLAKQRSDIPPDLTAIIERMIKKNPNDRYQTFDDILQELQSTGQIAADIPMHRSGIVPLPARQFLQQTLKQKNSRFARWFVRLVFAVVISLLGWSLGYCYQTWIHSPFPAAKSLEIAKMETVEAQWIQACFLNTPDAWQSVIDYFPQEEYLWGRKAKRQLIRYYYTNNNTFGGFLLFQDFAELSDVDIEDQMLGLAGLAWCTAENQNDMAIPQDYLSRINMANFSFEDDPLFIQILDAAKKIIEQKRKNKNES
jgi:serine/threonine-protein kinase